MTRSKLLLGLSALCLAAIAAPALAASPKGSAKTGLADLTQLNLIVIQDMTAGADVEGKSWIGGNLNNANTMGIGSNANPSQGFTPSTFATLAVGGNVTGNLNLNNGPNGTLKNAVTPAGATIGGNVGTINLNAANATLLVGGSIGQTNGGNGATIEAGGGLGSNSHPTGVLVKGDLGAAFATPLQKSLSDQTATFVSDLKSLSSALAALSPTAGASFNDSDPNNATFKAVDTGKLGYAVIDITTAQLQDARNLQFDLAKVGGGYLTTVINVIGSGSVAISANDNAVSVSPYVIWNFESASHIDTNTQFNGSLLAPLASVANHSPINGAVAVKSFTQGGEVHLGTFAGDPALSKAISGAVPEPSTWMMLIGGVGLVGGALRRRRAMAGALVQTV